MSISASVCVPIVGAGVTVAFSVWTSISGARERTMEDVEFFLRHSDLHRLENLLDPNEEAILRSQMSLDAFRKLQRKRISAAIEQIGMMSHNSSVLFRCSQNEFSKIRHKASSSLEQQDTVILEVIRLSSTVRRMCIIANFKLRVWRLIVSCSFPFMPIPRLCDLREMLGHDILLGYEHLMSSVGEMSLQYGQERYDQIMSAL